MIYSEAFDSMPAVALDRIYRDLYDMMLRDEDRRAVYEILLETKANVPAYWRQVNAAP